MILISRSSWISDQPKFILVNNNSDFSLTGDFLCRCNFFITGMIFLCKKASLKWYLVYLNKLSEVTELWKHRAEAVLTPCKCTNPHQICYLGCSNNLVVFIDCWVCMLAERENQWVLEHSKFQFYRNHFNFIVVLSFPGYDADYLLSLISTYYFDICLIWTILEVRNIFSIQLRQLCCNPWSW